MSTYVRANLGDFSSIVCFKSVITGMEDALGEKATAISLITAGRLRGKNLANSLGLANSSLSFAEIASILDNAFGKNGTRLTAISKIEQESDVIKVYCTETVCSAGEELGSSRTCTFTMGAIWGALEVITGKKFQGKHTDSVLRGSEYDLLEFTLRA
jgi:predicted hydrocarbon binding protein